MGFGKWRDNTAAGSITTDNFGNKQVGGAMGLLNPFLGGDNAAIVERAEDSATRRAGQKRYDESAYGDKLGIDRNKATVAGVKAAELNIQDEKAEKQAQDQLEKSLKVITKQQEPAQQTAANSLTLGRENIQLAKDKMSGEERRFLASMESGRADNAANRLQEMRIMQMQSDASDRRYEQDREYYQQDKQQAALQTLVASLASLGGAFAL